MPKIIAKTATEAKLLEMFYGGGNVIRTEDLVLDVKRIMAQEGDVVTAEKMAKVIGLEIPVEWYEESLLTAICTGDLYGATHSLARINRSFKVDETKILLEQIITNGDVIALKNFQTYSDTVFHLAVWQNTLLIKIVRLLWIKKYKVVGPSVSIGNFHTAYSSVVTGFKIKSNDNHILTLIDKTFLVFSNGTMSQFVFALSQLDASEEIMDIAHEIAQDSPIF